MTIEGKKTVSLEIFKQLKKVPDIILVPTGDGCILAGVYKGFMDLLDLKIIKKMPIIYAVQAEGSNAIALAYQSGKFAPIQASTVADSISVDIPRNGYHALSLLTKYNGKVITVTDAEIIQAQKYLSTTTGLFTEPAGATAIAGLIKLKDEIPAKSTVVALCTGSGLKDVATAMKGVSVLPKAIKSLDEII